MLRTINSKEVLLPVFAPPSSNSDTIFLACTLLLLATRCRALLPWESLAITLLKTVVIIILIDESPDNGMYS